MQDRLRNADVPVIGRIEDDLFGLDMRSVPERFDRQLIEVLIRTLN